MRVQHKCDKSRHFTWVAISPARLKDPDSAQFKSVFFSKFENIPVVCGQVNSKNGFGGYTGYQHFIAAGEAIGYLQEQMTPSEFVKAWNKMCARRS